MHGGADLLCSIYPNGAVKWFWATMLLAGGYIGNFGGSMFTHINHIKREGELACIVEVRIPEKVAVRQALLIGSVSFQSLQSGEARSCIPSCSS